MIKLDYFLPAGDNFVNSEALCTKQVAELEARLEDTDIEDGKNSSPRVTGVSSRVSLSVLSWDSTLSSAGVSALLIDFNTV